MKKMLFTTGACVLLSASVALANYSVTLPAETQLIGNECLGAVEIEASVNLENKTVQMKVTPQTKKCAALLPTKSEYFFEMKSLSSFYRSSTKTTTTNIYCGSSGEIGMYVTQDFQGNITYVFLTWQVTPKTLLQWKSPP
jgi:hypothetical protein